MTPPDHPRAHAELDQPHGECAPRPPAQPRGRSTRPPTAPAAPPMETPTEAAYAAAVQQINAQLDPHEATARQTIDQVVRQVGVTIANWAVGLAQQA